MENTGYWFLWMSPEEAEKHWVKPRKTKRTHRQSAATDVKPKWTRLSISCCFTCQAAALLNTDGGWLVRAIPLQLNDGPTASCPSGGKHFFKKKEVHEPCCRLSWQQITRPTSSPPVQTTTPPHVPPAPVQTAVGAWSKTAKHNCRVHSSSCRCFFQPVMGVFALPQRWKKTCCHIVVFSRLRGGGLTWHDLAGGQVFWWMYSSITRCRNGCY